MSYNLSVREQFAQAMIAAAEMIHPYRSINKNHLWHYWGRRLGMDCSFFSVPPSLASRLLASRAIKASSPSRTKAVFSLIPVIRDALAKISSSMLSVERIHINMHQSCIFVNPHFYPYSLSSKGEKNFGSSRIADVAAGMNDEFNVQTRAGPENITFHIRVAKGTSLWSASPRIVAIANS